MKDRLNKCRITAMGIQVISTVFFLLLLTTAVYAAGGEEGHHGVTAADLKDLAWRTMNFVILAGFLYWLVGNRIKEYFTGRRDNIRITLEEARAAKEDAEKKYKELSEKLDKATSEISDISEMIKAQGLAEKEKIIQDAKKAAEKLKEDAQRRVEQEFNKASNQLRADAVALSVQIAEDLLKKNITVEDHDNMVRDYLDKVVIKH
jgi:F-type H+-transporting ATPase subunit b